MSERTPNWIPIGLQNQNKVAARSPHTRNYNIILAISAFTSLEKFNYGINQEMSRKAQKKFDRFVLD
jgi:hypothetical protein